MSDVLRKFIKHAATRYIIKGLSFSSICTGRLLNVFLRNRSIETPLFPRKTDTRRTIRSSPLDGHSPSVSAIEQLTVQTYTQQGSMSTVKTAPYGSWKSPFTSRIVSQNAVSFQEVRTDPLNPGIVYWSECRFDEGGRYVICSQKGGEPFQALTPKDYNARTKVHEYGGGAFFVHAGNVYFSNFKDQRMYVQKMGDSSPNPITPDESFYRYADGDMNSKTGMIYCVREDHSAVERKEAKDPTNTVVVINPNTQQQTVLAEGCDFYSHPRVSPDGKKIAWIQWNHPNMPWDTTELWTADVAESGESLVAGSAKLVAGGNDVSVIEPGWTTDSELLYVSDTTDWWNLYHVTSAGEHVNLLPLKKEIGGPHWNFNASTYAVDQSGNGRIITIMGGELGVLNMKNGHYKKIESDFTSHRFVNITSAGEVYCVGGSPVHSFCVLLVNPETNQVTVVKESKSLDIDKGYFSEPETVTWNTTEKDVAHGYYYPPQNKDFKGTEGTKPPLLVKAHGGPTASSPNVLNLKIQYFTCRGFGVLDVNYRGSTGYGRKYRRKLLKNWGVYDVDDCCTGAQHLADSGKVDPEKLCIDGGSAGGYTTLACLTFKDTFKAGASHYGVCDLEALATDTHKFESRYLDSVIGPYSVEGKEVYKKRSPINFVNQIKCPMAFFQGDEDKIVPPNQAEIMYKAVKEKGLPTMFVLFKGEQHGFRKSENIEAALDGELYFFSKVFKFEAADIDCKSSIDNL